MELNQCINLYKERAQAMEIDRDEPENAECLKDCMPEMRAYLEAHPDPFLNEAIITKCTLCSIFSEVLGQKQDEYFFMYMLLQKCLYQAGYDIEMLNAFFGEKMQESQKEATQKVHEFLKTKESGAMFNTIDAFELRNRCKLADDHNCCPNETKENPDNVIYIDDDDLPF